MFNAKFFQPITVSIYPGDMKNGYWRCLVDYNVSSSEEAKALGSMMLHDKAEFLVVKRGISFTILRADSTGSIFFDNNRNLFYSHLDIREKISEIEQKTERGFHVPELYVKTAVEGFEIGLITAESSKKSTIGGDDKELLKITTLPYSAIGLYKWSNMRSDQVEKIITPFGWRKKEIENPTLYEAPAEFEHTYFDVTVFRS